MTKRLREEIKELETELKKKDAELRTAVAFEKLKRELAVAKRNAEMYEGQAESLMARYADDLEGPCADCGSTFSMEEKECVPFKCVFCGVVIPMCPNHENKNDLYDWEKNSCNVCSSFNE